MPEITPQLRRGLIALAAVLLFAGAVGAAMVANDSDDGDIVAGPDSSTTLAGGADTTNPDAPSGSPTTTGESSATAPATTAKAKGSATTAGPPATRPASADPGPARPPALGSYRYATVDTDADGTRTAERIERIEAGESGGGVTRRVTNREEDGATLRYTQAWAGDGVRQERLFVKSSQGGQSAEFDCDWQPDLLVYAQPLSIGTKWTADSSCETTAKTPQGEVPVKLRVQGERRVVGRANTTVGGTQVLVWIIEETRTDTLSSGAQTVRTDNSTGVTHFEPTRGLDVYEKSNTKSTGFGGGDSNSERRLLNLNPS